MKQALFLHFVLSFFTLETVYAFTLTRPTLSRFDTAVYSSAKENDEQRVDRMRDIIAEESLNVDNMRASAEQVKNWSTDDMERALESVQNLSPDERKAMEKMGMDPNMMQQAMQQIKDNPAMKDQIVKLMQNMTPEEMLQQSKEMQALMKQQQQQQQALVEETPNAEIVDKQEEDEKNDDEEEEEEDEEPVELDPNVLDAMYKVGELMSEPPEQGGVTLAAFRTLPPINVLSGNGDDDLSDRELRECWSQGSLGASRVDRVGFERVWAAVQENYYNDICEEARERLLVQKKKKRGSATTAKPSSPPSPTTAASPSNVMPTNTPMVGSQLTPEQLQAQIKNMKDEDLTRMFDQMSNMTPADEARLKAMGVDPVMMKKSAAMMKNNPLLRKAATMMMKNTSPEQLMKASQEAQAKMANMSEEEKQQILDNLK